MRKRTPGWTLRFVGWTLMAVITFGAGAATVALELPPYRAYQELRFKLFGRPRLPPIDGLGTDARTLIGIHDVSDVVRLRNWLDSVIWGSGGLPTSTRPANVERQIVDPLYANLSNLGRIDRLTIDMEWGLQSVAYHFVPDHSSGDLMVYHEGHGGGFGPAKYVIDSLLQHGHAVIAMAMPLLGLNNQPVVTHDRLGTFRATVHNHLQYLKPSEGHPIRYFLDPVAAVVNYAEGLGYRRTNMMGISGGGWTTTMYAALDPRIAHSYPVAGTIPIYLRNEISDFEQSTPDIYGAVTYLELYVLGAFGEGRKQLQILNAYDPCCSPGVRASAYETAVVEVVTQLGAGTFEVFVDYKEVVHRISEGAINAILQDLERSAPATPASGTGPSE